MVTRFMAVGLANAIPNIDQIIVNWFNQFGVWGNLLLIVLSILASTLFSGVIGFEREYHGHAAGLRTHMLVSIGSSLIMIISIYGFDPAVFATRDPARLAAQVISGIGFLGAGTIIQTGTDIKGLTTATTLWFVMAIGLASGAGRFVLAALATLTAFLVLVSLRKIEKMANRHFPKITLVVPSDKPVLKEAHTIGARYGVNIRDVQSQVVILNGVVCLRVTINCAYASKATTTAFSEELREVLKPIEFRVASN